MLKNVFLAVAVVVLGLTTCFLITRSPAELRDKKLDERVRVDLDGVASVALPIAVSAGGRQ